jgi:hypothetical protein
MRGNRWKKIRWKRKKTKRREAEGEAEMKAVKDEETGSTAVEAVVIY